MALRRGLALRDMEMVQFHPTGLLAGDETKMTGTVLEEGCVELGVICLMVTTSGSCSIMTVRVNAQHVILSVEPFMKKCDETNITVWRGLYLNVASRS